MKKLFVQIKAFTILEMLAGMAISVLVVLLGFYGVQLAQKQYRLFQKTTDITQDYRHLEALLWHDFTFAQRVEKQNDSLLLCTNEKASISYLFSTNHTLRSVVRVEDSFEDTLQVQVSVVEVTLDGKPVHQGLIDNCIFSIQPFGEKHLYPVRKIYSAQERMNYEKKHER